jgi:hypothetical protein
MRHRKGVALKYGVSSRAQEKSARESFLAGIELVYFTALGHREKQTKHLEGPLFYGPR